MMHPLRVTTPGGLPAHYGVRPDTSDGSLVIGIVQEDEYSLKALPPLSGWAIDIGAHIGTVAIALAVDNPDLSVVAVEALPDNADLLSQNVAMNRLGDRVHVFSAAAGSEAEVEAERKVPITYGWSRSINQPDDYMHQARFIGGMVGPNDTSQTVECNAISLGAIFRQFDIDDCALLKIDCEGCEWFVLTSPYVAKIGRIIGEMHTGSHGTPEYLHELLDPTHDLVIEKPDISVSLFTAVRRSVVMAS